jgi:dolichol kinase
MRSFSYAPNRCDQGAEIAMKKNVWRAMIEVGFIIFLFYSNLLMGEFERSGPGAKKGVAWAIGDIFTAANFEIAMIAALVGFILFEFLRKRF